jgi:hypothetical protein
MASSESLHVGIVLALVTSLILGGSRRAEAGLPCPVLS